VAEERWALQEILQTELLDDILRTRGPEGLVHEGLHDLALGLLLPLLKVKAIKLMVKMLLTFPGTSAGVSKR
jgi:hypothetical protein